MEDLVCEVPHWKRVERLFFQYADALNFRRLEILSEIFAEDIITDWLGKSSQTGRADAIAYISRALEGVKSSHHLFGNIVVSVKGDEASASGRARAFYVGLSDREEDFVDTMVTYSIEAAQTQGCWKIRRFSEALHIMRGNPAIFGQSS